MRIDLGCMDNKCLIAFVNVQPVHSPVDADIRYCKQRPGGSLVSIESRRLNEFLYSMLNDPYSRATGYLLIGAHRDEQTDQWRWQSNSETGGNL